MRERTSVAIIGGGDSGIALANRMLAQGMDFMLFEMSPILGGLQYFQSSYQEWECQSDRMPTLIPAPPHPLSAHENIHTGVQVHGISRALEVVVEKEDSMYRIQADKIYVAAGSHEKPLVFPGWTLPGVITSQAAQILFYRDGILPGERVAYVLAKNENDRDRMFLQHLKRNCREVEVIDGRHIEKMEYYRMGNTNNLRYVAFGRTIELNALDVVICASPRLPSSELIRMVEAKMKVDKNFGVYPIVDESGQTSIPGVYAVGSVAAVPENLEEDCGFRWEDEFTAICRCEEVNRAEIDDAAKIGATTLDDIKRMTRCGMGPCQWKSCHSSVMEILDESLNERFACEPAHIRFPLFPVTIDALASMSNRDHAEVIDILQNALKTRDHYLNVVRDGE